MNIFQVNRNAKQCFTLLKLASELYGANFSQRFCPWHNFEIEALLYFEKLLNKTIIMNNHTVMTIYFCIKSKINKVNEICICARTHFLIKFQKFNNIQQISLTYIAKSQNWIQQ